MMLFVDFLSDEIFVDVEGAERNSVRLFVLLTAASPMVKVPAAIRTISPPDLGL